MKVAIVCEWITGRGGAERVVLELHKMFPKAPIYTSQYDPKKADWFEGLDIRTGWLQKIPTSLRKFLPVLRAIYFSRLDLSGYDLVISSAGAEAKFIKTKASTVHISYVHAPTHYYWSRYDEYLRNPGFGKLNWLARIGLRALVSPMRRWDYRAAQKPDYLIANSSHTKNQIKKYYHRNSHVIPPPVNIDRFKSLRSNKPRSGFVCISRFAPYKRVDLAVSACTNLNLPLVVMGGGPELENLKRIAGPSVKFVIDPTDEQIDQALASAEGFIFPGLDDFGIAPLEALASGVPVVAYKAGGALDYVLDGKNGLFFDHQNTKSLENALENFNISMTSNEISKTAQKFSDEDFKLRFNEFIEGIK